MFSEVLLVMYNIIIIILSVLCTCIFYIYIYVMYMFLCYIAGKYKVCIRGPSPGVSYAVYILRNI